MRHKTEGKRNIWTNAWLRRRDEKGAYNNIIAELRLEDKEHFRYYLRMNIPYIATFEVWHLKTTVFWLNLDKGETYWSEIK